MRHHEPLAPRQFPLRRHLPAVVENIARQWLAEWITVFQAFAQSTLALV
jgi:hypothetical protein